MMPPLMGFMHRVMDVASLDKAPRHPEPILGAVRATKVIVSDPAEMLVAVYVNPLGTLLIVTSVLDLGHLALPFSPSPDGA